MFGFIKNKIKKVYDQFTSKASSIFSKSQLDEEFLKELKNLLLTSDTGVKTTNKIIEQLENRIKNNKITNPSEAKQQLEEILLEIVSPKKSPEYDPKVLLLVGINGSGKTTFISKFANKLKESGKKVLLVAGDTFRAAAVEQLNEWSKKIGVEVFIGNPNQDPSSVIFDACKKYKNENFDHIIIDTAGRLQTKKNLMLELEKITKVIKKVLPEEEIFSWLTVDAMLGQNSFTQAKTFKESTNLNGIVLTKMDGTGKGGIVFSIVEELEIPILYITFGENLKDISVFNAIEYVSSLFEK